MKLSALLLFTLAVHASTMYEIDPSPCPPNFQVDSIAIPAGCSNLTYRVIAEPSVGLVAINDNPVSEGICTNGGTGDCDFNDGSVYYQITPSATAGLEDVSITWDGALSAWTNYIGLGDIRVGAAICCTFYAGAFPEGSPLDFVAYAQDGNVYDSLRTDQGADWFWVSQSFATSGTPEIGTILLVFAGLAGLLSQRSAPFRR